MKRIVETDESGALESLLGEQVISWLNGNGWLIATLAELNPPLPISPPAPQQTGVEGERWHHDGKSVWLPGGVEGVTQARFTCWSAHEADRLCDYLNSLTQSRPACEHRFVNRGNSTDYCTVEFCTMRDCKAWRIDGVVLLPQPEGGK